MNPALTAFKALVRKDVVTFLRDRRALIVSIVTPIIVAAFFGFIFGGTGDSSTATRVPVALVDEDRSPLSQAVIADLVGESSLAAQSMPREAARRQVGSGKLRAAVVFPAGFGDAATDALFGGAAKPPVDLLYDPSESFVRPIVEGLLTQHVMQQVMRSFLNADGSTKAIDATIARLRQRANPAPDDDQLVAMLQAVRQYQARPSDPARPAGAVMSVPFTLTSVPVSSGPAYNSYAHSFAGMSVQFILFMGIEAGIALLMMREQGMWQRLRAAPLSRGVLLGSRVAGTALIGLLMLAGIYLAAILIFGVRIAGNVAGFAAVAVALSLLAATLGLMIAGVGRSVGATRGLAIFATLLLVMLGGAWVPAFLFPPWLQRVSQFAPTRWAVDGLDAMTWRGLPGTAAVLPVAVLLGWSAVLVLIALWRFDWEAE